METMFSHLIVLVATIGEQKIQVEEAHFGPKALLTKAGELQTKSQVWKCQPSHTAPWISTVLARWIRGQMDLFSTMVGL